METLKANTTAVAGQDALNLRPLPNRIGHNGPYFGMGAPIAQDAARIEGHSSLFRDLDKFEPDLRQAVLWTWEGMTGLHLVRQHVAAGEKEAGEAIDMAMEVLESAFRWLQEAYLIAEVLDDREAARLRNRAREDFLALIGTRPAQAMKSMERLAEEGRLEWQLSMLRKRLRQVAQGGGEDHAADERQRLADVTAKLERAIEAPEAEALQALNDNDLSAELHALEERIRTTRKTIGLIHAIRTVRNA